MLVTLSGGRVKGMETKQTLGVGLDRINRWRKMAKNQPSGVKI